MGGHHRGPNQRFCKEQRYKWGSGSSKGFSNVVPEDTLDMKHMDSNASGSAEGRPRRASSKGSSRRSQRDMKLLRAYCGADKTEPGKAGAPLANRMSGNDPTLLS